MSAEPDLDVYRQIVDWDPYLAPHLGGFAARHAYYKKRVQGLTGGRTTLCGFSQGHKYFGLHKSETSWVLREWAPNARAIYLVGPFSQWREHRQFRLQKIDPGGVWEIRLPRYSLKHGDHYNLTVQWSDGQGTRLPSYARRVVQVVGSEVFNAMVWDPPDPYHWKHPHFRRKPEAPLVYEAHVGMATETGEVGGFTHFRKYVLPRIADYGYNTIQLMAIAEHPYYASFGYHVTNYFAPSSRFGTPEELKVLVDAAHALGIAVIMDLVHSHASKNEVEGLSRFDGTYYQYFHNGPRGHHPDWDSRCFDYGKNEVLHFLLSNCRYWVEEFKFDGFRFDGVTSMLLKDHGAGPTFSSYNDMFGDRVDLDALAYLALANDVIHTLNPSALTVAEDWSGMAGLTYPGNLGGCGFDFRLAMGIPDYWIRTIKEVRDEFWHVGDLWFNVTNRRRDEKTIAYAESHDQALVGDQTIIFRLIGKDMYESMSVFRANPIVERGLALHKLIRLITMTAGGDGYLNFMGNEFGHPEWIDFPREGNNWSHQFARRQWNLVHDDTLVYKYLLAFDHAMIGFVRETRLLESPPAFKLEEHLDKHLLVYWRGGYVFAFNFHLRSVPFHEFEVPPGRYEMVFHSEEPRFGGNGLIPMNANLAAEPSVRDNQVYFHLGLPFPARSVVVLRRLQTSADHPYLSGHP